MARAQGGDRAAYAALLRAITPQLRGFVANRLTPGNAEVDDVVQDILLSIHRAAHTYDAARPFAPWMFAIARFRLADYLRAAYRAPQGTDVESDHLPGAGNDSASTREDLTRLLTTLPERARRIVVGMKVEGRSAAEMALELGMNAGAVKVAAHRALKALRRAAQESEGT